MKKNIRVAAPPAKPLVIYDGDCRFCTLWIQRCRQITGAGVDYLPSQEPLIAEQFPEITPEQLASAVQLVEPDGMVYSGAEAVFRMVARKRFFRWPLSLYEQFPLFAAVTEGMYNFVAGHRTIFSWLTRLLWGKQVEQPEFFLARWLFLRGMGLVYLAAFISLWVQVSGLIGSHGILPAADYISEAKQFFDAHGVGIERLHRLPTLCWFSASDVFLIFQCAAGTALAGLLFFDVAPALCLALLWVLYLSLVAVSRDFFGFQWDNLLLEAGFLAIFFAPWQWLPRPSRETKPSRLVRWLLMWLLFRLMFESGCVKLLSHDSNWSNLTALTFHYETQPLPTWIGWYANQLPLMAQKISCALMFFIELAMPFLIFSPRRLRFFAFGALVLLQIVIMLTGNYAFFNWITICLCFLLLDDFALQKLMPRRLTRAFAIASQSFLSRGNRRRSWITVPLAIIIISVSTYEMIVMFGDDPSWLEPVAAVQQWLDPFRSVNNYGLFAVMTTERKEIIIEGSDNGLVWRPYEFKFKPGDLQRRPEFVAPYQPRLDWQMWFAALGTAEQNPWFENFCLRLLQGSPPVLALLKTNPFPDHPPRYIRAEAYQYHFTNFAERRQTGAWWKRGEGETYLSAVSLPARGGNK
jgi:predicted DCC family thiol-disulfide oxidoreductase YuxK